MKLFVAGGTGAVGRPAVRALVAAGHDVTVIARSPDKAAFVQAEGARPVTVSLFDRQGLTDAVTGCDAVVNLATAIPPTNRFLLPHAWRENDRIRREGSATLAAAAQAAGVGRFVQESVSMIYPDSGADWIDESVPPDDFPVARGNLAAEASANRFAAAGGVGVILRFGWFYGPGAKHSEEFLALARRRVCIMMGQPGGYVSSIHVEDAGAAVEAALRVPSGTYNIVDDEPLTKRGYADALAAAAGVGTCLRLPGRAGMLFGQHTTSLTRSLRVSNGRFRAAGAWRPRYRSAREGWEATAAALSHGAAPRLAGGSVAR